MSDGATKGITAIRALKTIIGGDEQPTDEETATREQTRERVMATPLFTGSPLWDTVSAKTTQEEKDDLYGVAADTICHAFVTILEEQPDLLDPENRPKVSDEYEIEDMRGQPIDLDTVLWDELKKRWPHADEWIGGASGFQVGFACNQAVWIVAGFVRSSNPAIIEIEGKSDG